MPKQRPGLPTMLVDRVVRKFPTFKEVRERGKNHFCGLPFGEVVVRTLIFPSGTHTESAEIFGDCFHGSALKYNCLLMGVVWYDTDFGKKVNRKEKKVPPKRDYFCRCSKTVYFSKESFPPTMPHDIIHLQVAGGGLEPPTRGL